MKPQENNNRFRIGDRYRDRAWVLDTLDISNATLHRRMEKHSNFPRPIEIHGTRTKRWIEREVYEYAQWLAGDPGAPGQSAASEVSNISNTVKPADRDATQAASQSVPEDSGAELSAASASPRENLRPRIKKSGGDIPLNMSRNKPRTVEVQVKRSRVYGARDGGVSDSAGSKGCAIAVESDQIRQVVVPHNQDESALGSPGAKQGEEGQS